MAHVCWTPTCASRPRTSCSIGYCRKACSIGYCRKQRGPPSGRTQLSRPAVVRPGTLRAGTHACRRHLFSLVLRGPLTHAVCSSPDLVCVWDKDPTTVELSLLLALVWTPWPAVARMTRTTSQRLTTQLPQWCLFRHRSSTCNPSQVGRHADCSCVTRRQRCWHHHIRAHWFELLHTCTTTPTMHFLKSPVLARIRLLSNARSMPFFSQRSRCCPRCLFCQVPPLGRQR